VIIIAMPIAALVLYLALGSPNLPDQPVAARIAAPPETQDVAALVARVEQQLALRPEDGRGWELLAPVYLRLGRYDDAVAAFKNASRLLGATAARESNLGEAVVAVNGGRVTAEAEAAFGRARALAPDDPKARFYQAVLLEQQGKTADAVAAWRSFIATAPPDPAWTMLASSELARLVAAPSAPAAGTAAPGPGTDEVAAAQNLPPEQQTAMIEGMVSKLAVSLQSDSGNADGWAMLVRSYMVLGRAEDARAALDKAKVALASDRGKTALVEDAARSAGLVP
jgi:cytochrome c-type biogenesis protein CcmH